MREIETMTRTEIASLYQSPASFSGKKVTVCGWVRTIRDSKALGFMELNDGSCFKGVQVVFEDKKIDNFKEIAKLNVGAAVTLTVSLWKLLRRSSLLSFTPVKFWWKARLLRNIRFKRSATAWST